MEDGLTHSTSAPAFACVVPSIKRAVGVHRPLLFFLCVSSEEVNELIMISFKNLASKTMHLLPCADFLISPGKQPCGLSSSFNYSTGLNLLTNLLEMSYENH